MLCAGAGLHPHQVQRLEGDLHLAGGHRDRDGSDPGDDDAHDAIDDDHDAIDDEDAAAGDDPAGHAAPRPAPPAHPPHGVQPPPAGTLQPQHFQRHLGHRSVCIRAANDPSAKFLQIRRRPLLRASSWLNIENA